MSGPRDHVSVRQSNMCVCRMPASAAVEVAARHEDVAVGELHEPGAEDVVARDVDALGRVRHRVIDRRARERRDPCSVSVALSPTESHIRIFPLGSSALKIGITGAGMTPDHVPTVPGSPTAAASATCGACRAGTRAAWRAGRPPLERRRRSRRPRSAARCCSAAVRVTRMMRLRRGGRQAARRRTTSVSDACHGAHSFGRASRYWSSCDESSAMLAPVAFFGAPLVTRRC